MRFSIRKLLLAVFVLAAIGGLAAHFWPKPTPVDAAAIERGALSITLEADGATRIRDRFVVTAPVAGLLARVELHAGDAVAPRQVVARIAPVLLDPPSLEQAKLAYRSAAARVDQAESAVSAATTVLELARKKHREVESLYSESNGRLATQGQVDDAWAEVEVKEDSLEEAKKALAVVRFDFQRARAAVPRRQWSADLDDVKLPDDDGPASEPPTEDHDQTLILSPLDAPGRVLQVSLQGPATVSPSTPILEIGDVSTIEVVIDLLTGDAESIAAGASVELKGWGGKTLSGTVDRIDPKAFTKLSALGVEEQRVNVFVKLDSAPVDSGVGLGDGYSVQATLLVSRRENVVLAPIGALFGSSIDSSVFVIANRRAELRKVRLGDRNDNYAHVIEGLQPDDLVILHPSESLREGDLVEPKLTSAAKTANAPDPAAQRL